MMYQVNVEISYLPQINHIAKDVCLCMNLDECREFIESTKKLFSDSGVKRLRFTIWQIEKCVSQVKISDLYS